MLTELLESTLADVKTLEAQVFESPPKDWPEFQNRYGRWLQANATLAQLTKLLEGEEP